MKKCGEGEIHDSFLKRFVFYIAFYISNYEIICQLIGEGRK